MTNLKQFVAGFNFQNPAWFRLPVDFPDCDLSELTSVEKADFELIKIEWIRAGRPSTNTTNTSYTSYSSKPHGGYRNLEAFKLAEIIYDFTVEFCETYMTYKTNKSYRTYDQMVQAARSGKQNIAEGSQRAAVSPSTELQLVDVARASQEELLQDFQDFLRVNKLPQWSKEDPRTLEIRKIAYKTDKSYTTYKSYMSNPESAANCAICLISQTNYLLDRLLSSLSR